MLRILLILLFIPPLTWALPQKVEVWFLSTPKTSFIDLKTKIKYAQSRLQCQPMGEYCFDPQVGLYKKGKENEVLIVDEGGAAVEDKVDYDFVAPASSLDRKLIECEKDQMFDIFCGKSKAGKTVSQPPLEVWIDVSSTMKQVDVPVSGSCVRESFVRLLNQTCPVNEKMKIYSFEEYRKEVGSLERVCQSQGLNNMNRLVDDIKKSKAKKIIIITDIFEASEKFINQIELTGVGEVKGVDTPFYSTDLKAQLKRVRNFCL